MPRERQPCVYILANRRNGALYTGVTSDPPQRFHQHREGLIPGFTRDYGIKRLVWYEMHETMEAAILREKRIKDWKRAWKVDLIEAANPEWRDMAEDQGFAPLPSSARRGPVMGPGVRRDDDEDGDIPVRGNDEG